MIVLARTSTNFLDLDQTIIQQDAPNVIIIIKSRRMTWVVHVAFMGAKVNAYRCWWESQKENEHQNDLRVGGG
jgi:hypothetical protein